jgi:hypothetical protein
MRVCGPRPRTPVVQLALGTGREVDIRAAAGRAQRHGQHRRRVQGRHVDAPRVDVFDGVRVVGAVEGESPGSGVAMDTARWDQSWPSIISQATSRNSIGRRFVGSTGATGRNASAMILLFARLASPARMPSPRRLIEPNPSREGRSVQYRFRSQLPKPGRGPMLLDRADINVSCAGRSVRHRMADAADRRPLLHVM